MINQLYRTVGNVLSPQGDQARLSILIYHRVLPEQDILFPWEVTADTFDKQLSHLRIIFNVLPFEEAIERLKSGKLPPRSACITFDDGYADNVTIALEILNLHGLKAAFFIATKYLNGGCMFNDKIIHAIRHSRDTKINITNLGLGKHSLESIEAKRHTIDILLKHIKYLPLRERESTAQKLADLITDIEPPTDLMMDDLQLKKLRDSGMTIGGHTVSHPILAKLDSDEFCREIVEGKACLEALLGIKVKFFAYPNGKPGIDYLPNQVDIIRKLGFEAAVSTQWGTANRKSDLFQLPRFTPYANSIMRFTSLMFQNMMRSTN